MLCGGPGGVRRPSSGRPAALRRSPFEHQNIEKMTSVIRFSRFCAPDACTNFLAFSVEKVIKTQGFIRFLRLPVP